MGKKVSQQTELGFRETKKRAKSFGKAIADKENIQENDTPMRRSSRNTCATTPLSARVLLPHLNEDVNSAGDKFSPAVESKRKKSNGRICKVPKSREAFCDVENVSVDSEKTNLENEISCSDELKRKKISVSPITPPEEKPTPLLSPRKEDADLENKENVPVTPKVNKQLRSSILLSNSLTCSALSRKRRLAFPGYEYYQQMKSAFCPKQQILFDDLDRRLAVSETSFSAKEVIPGRESEIDRLLSMLNDVIDLGKSASLYISGPPGTGKSACVTAVIQQMLLQRGRNVARVNIVNCVRCRTQQSILQCLQCTSDGTTLDSKKASLPMIVVLDEVDQIEVQHHDFVYRMFEWVKVGGKRRIALIAIANALDLTERVLPRLALSSVKPQLMHYKPYSAPQIVKIIQERVNKVIASADNPGASFPVLDRGAMELCARKVASSTGDARKALELCRKAVEVVQNDAIKQYNSIQALDTPPASPNLSQDGLVANSQPGLSSRVTISIMNKVILDSTTSWASISQNTCSSGMGDDDRRDDSVSQRSDSCPLHHKVLITALARLTQLSSAAHFSMQQVLNKYASVCNEKAICSLDQSQLLMVLNLLEARGLLQLTSTNNRKNNAGTDFRHMKVYVKGNLFELLSAKELEV